jgi:hypothetical protein
MIGCASADHANGHESRHGHEETRVSHSLNLARMPHDRAHDGPEDETERAFDCDATCLVLPSPAPLICVHLDGLASLPVAGCRSLGTGCDRGAARAGLRLCQHHGPVHPSLRRDYQRRGGASCASVRQGNIWCTPHPAASILCRLAASGCRSAIVRRTPSATRNCACMRLRSSCMSGGRTRCTPCAAGSPSRPSRRQTIGRRSTAPRCGHH